MLASDAVKTVRSMMTGSLMDEISVLDTAYDPLADNFITLRYPKRNLAVGVPLSVGLNTFVVLSVSTDGTRVDVMPSVDGSPNVAAPAGEMVLIRPQFTTYSIFRELQSEIQSMSSVDCGLFATIIMQSEGINYQDGTYSVDPLDIPAGREVIRMAKAEWRISDTNAWQAFGAAEWQHSGQAIRVAADPPGATEYAFTLATTFGQVADLTTDLDAVCGVPDAMADIPMLGACATLALGWEGRRTQPFAQGDSRRAAEVQVGSNSGLSRTYMAKQQKRVNEELARLLSKYGWRQQMTTGESTGLGYGVFQ